MKIVLVNHKNPNSVGSFSGTSYFMRNELKKEFGEVIEFTLEEPENYLGKKKTARMISQQLKGFGNQLSEFLRNNCINADFVICQGGNAAIPFYNHATPIVYWHDSTWHTFLNVYTKSSQFLKFRWMQNHYYQWDQKALARANLIFFSSDYVKEACIKNYRLSEQKIKIIPFGANLNCLPNEDFIIDALDKRRRSKSLNLTFVGKDWRRKGLTHVFDLTEKLNEANIKTTLNIIGCTPDDKIVNSAYVRTFDRLDKENPNDNKLLTNILANTHFLIHPASNEPFGVSLCEANAYAIPVIGTRVEGLKTIVIDGKNGFLFGKENFVAESFEKIKELFYDFENKYIPLSKSSWYEFNTRLNWSTSVKKLKEYLMRYQQ